MTDASARVKRRVERLISRAVAELQSRGVDTTGKPPRQILMIARAAKGRPRISTTRKPP